MKVLKNLRFPGIKLTHLQFVEMFETSEREEIYMSVKMFIKDFKDIKSCEKVSATLIIPVIIAVALGLTLFRFLKKTK